ncbi:hypothetical protein KOJCDNHJ_02123 [Xanthomonas citri pv. punicae]|nr:hypothetical protein FICKIIDM_03851 [Xanthomonas citri pv. punicae]UIS28728.1 hypothetical protein KOJCDNHJ_02123 [Xanthomonas citri pv. punicae]
MTQVTLLKRLTLVALTGVATSTVANAATARGPENSTLHIGLRLLSGCELRTAPPRALLQGHADGDRRAAQQQ